MSYIRCDKEKKRYTYVAFFLHMAALQGINDTDKNLYICM